MRLHPAPLAILLAGLAAPGWAQPSPRNTTPIFPSRGSFFQRYGTEADAQGHCPGDTVVWVDTRSGVARAKGDPEYGRTRPGAYVCQGEMPARPQRGGTAGRSTTGQ